MATEHQAKDAARAGAKPAWFKRPVFCLVSLVTVLFGLLILCGWIWFHSTSDLDAVRDYARSKGVALTYEELLGPDAGDVRAVKLFKELTSLGEQLVVFADSSYALELDNYLKIPNFCSEVVLYPGMEIASELRCYYNEVHDQKIIADVLDRLRKLEPYGSKFLRLEDFDDGSSHVVGVNQLLIFFCEFALSAKTADEFNERVSYVIKLVAMLPEGHLINSLVQTAVTGLMLSAVQLRYHELDERRIKELRALREYFINYFLISLKYDCVLLFNSYNDVLSAYEESWGNKLDAWEEFELLVFSRFYRASSVQNFIDYVVGAQSGWVSFSDPLFQASYDSPSGYWARQGMELLPYRSGAVKSAKRTVIAFDLLFAEYDKTSWPNDIYGNQLLPIEKDGKIIGAYSMGEDGIDDGWENEQDEQEIWLYDYIEH